MKMLPPGNAEPQLGRSSKTNKAKLGLGVPRPDSNQPLGWHSRGYLPHFEKPGTLQAITFRLADSLPQSKLASLKKQLAKMPDETAKTERRKQIDKWLDAGMGCCALKHPEIAKVVQDTLLKFDGERYRLIAWCIMPNHVHAIIETKAALPKIVQSWKSFTGRWAMSKNAELGLGVPGKRFWMRDYWDRFIRNQEHYNNAVDYIHRNPILAGLCRQPDQWPWSSAAFTTNLKRRRCE